jgi:lipoprotein-anchoring transpeptidase ErfK/SrfK
MEDTMTQKQKRPRRKWSTAKRTEQGVVVAGRVIVERTIVSLTDYQLDYAGEGDGTHKYRVTVNAEIGSTDNPAAIVKAFSTLGERVAEDATRTP